MFVNMAYHVLGKSSFLGIYWILIIFNAPIHARLKMSPVLALALLIRKRADLLNRIAPRSYANA